jgi:hypothetical protein
VKPILLLAALALCGCCGNDSNTPAAPSSVEVVRERARPEMISPVAKFHAQDDTFVPSAYVFKYEGRTFIVAVNGGNSVVEVAREPTWMMPNYSIQTVPCIDPGMGVTIGTTTLESSDVTDAKR